MTQRNHTSFAGILGIAVLSLVVLCGAGSVGTTPIKDLLLQGDANGGGYALTNLGSIVATNSAALPTSTSIGGTNILALISAAETNALATVARTGSYTDLTNTPVIPTQTSQLTNNSGFLTNAPVTSVAGRTGVITLSSTDVTGLGSLATAVPTGTPAAGTYLQFDGTTFSWATPSGGGGGGSPPFTVNVSSPLVIDSTGTNTVIGLDGNGVAGNPYLSETTSGSGYTIGFDSSGNPAVDHLVIGAGTITLGGSIGSTFASQVNFTSQVVFSSNLNNAIGTVMDSVAIYYPDGSENPVVYNGDIYSMLPANTLMASGGGYPNPVFAVHAGAGLSMTGTNLTAPLTVLTGTLSSGTATETIPAGTNPWVVDTSSSPAAISITVSGTTATIHSNPSSSDTFKLFYSAGQ